MKNLFLFKIFVFLFIILFCTLGTWQLYRLQWKQDLISQISEGLKSTPIKYSLNINKNYQKVFLTGKYDFENQIYLYSLNDKGQPGFDVVTPFETSSKENVLINRGWIQKEFKNSLDINALSKNITGMLRQANRKNIFTPDNDINENIWFSDQIGNVDSKPSLSFSCVIKAEENSRGEYSAKRMTYDCTSPNGLIFSKDYRRLYVAQSDFNGNQRRQLRSYELDKNSNLIPHQVLHDFGPHRGIDGMALDIEGNIIATCGWEISGPGPMICVFDENGRILMSERTPCMRPSNLAFGGENLEDIYITSLEGHLYRVKNTGLKGNPLP